MSNKVPSGSINLMKRNVLCGIKEKDMGFDVQTVCLAEEKFFETFNGLWTGKKPPFVNAGVIRNTNFTESGCIDYSNVAYLQIEEKQLIKRQLKPGDIIVERSGGGPKQPVGRVVFFDRYDGRFSFSNFTSAIRVRDINQFDAKFIFYNLLELYQSGGTEDIQRRTTGIRNLDFTAYKERATFPQIFLAEQRKIAAVLSTMQRAIEEQERLLQLTKELKKSLLHKLFTEGLRGEPQKMTEIGPVPESWEVAELRDLCELIIDCPHTTPKFVSEGVRVVRNFNIRDGQFIDSPAFFTTEEDYLLRVSRCVPLPGDILFSREAPVGEACVVPDNLKLSLGQRTMVLRPKAYKLDATFMVYNFYSANIRNRIFATASGLTTPHLNVSDVRGLLVPLPIIAEQFEIASYVKAVDARLSALANKRRTLSDLFRTLLHQLVTAQIRVNEIDFPEFQVKIDEEVRG